MIGTPIESVSKAVTPIPKEKGSMTIELIKPTTIRHNEMIL